MTTAFFYGLFLDPELLRSLNILPKNFQLANLMNYDLIIGERANLIKRPGETVWGSVMNIKEHELEKLYAEPSVSDYKPYKVQCHLMNGDTINANVYLLPNNYQMKPASDNSYTQKLLNVCIKYNLPKDHISKIHDIMRKNDANTSR